VFVIATILFVFMAHAIRTYRWQTLLGSVSALEPKKLYFSLSISYILNSLLPIRIGDLFRIFYVGAKVRNVLLVTSTVLFERLADIFFLQLFFTSILILNYSDISQFQNVPITILIESIFEYLIVLALIGLFIILVITNSKVVKFLIVSVTNLLNKRFKIKILNLIFKFFQSNKQLFRYMNKTRYTLITILMWLFYILGYSTAQKALFQFGYTVNGFELLLNFTNPINNKLSFTTNFQLLVFVFYITPAILLLFFYFLVPRYTHAPNKIRSHQLDFRNEDDQLLFLEDYFYSKDRNWSKAYYEIFEGSEIIKDFTGLSDARTVLLQNKFGERIYRKFSIGSNNIELENQFNYMSKWSNEDHFIELEFERNNEYFFYNMPYREGFLPLNLGINFVPKHKIKSLTDGIFESLDTSLYSNLIHVDDMTHLIEHYYANKVLKNLALLENYLYYKSFKFDHSIIINGEEPGFIFSDVFNHFVENKDKHSHLLSLDKFTFSHGDLSAENVIINPSNLDFYFIDLLPPMNNLSSKASDLAKMQLSSKHNFELIRHQEVPVLCQNKLNFPIFENYKMKFLDERLESIIDSLNLEDSKNLVHLYSSIHWLRVISRRIRVNDPNSLIYIGSFILSMKDQIASPLN
jgi:hypothetical protein